MEYAAYTERSWLPSNGNVVMYGPLDNVSLPGVKVGASNLSNLTDAELNGGYGIRFVPYTVLCACCVLFNVVSLGAMMSIRGVRTVHHVLLLNLGTCDLVGSGIMWMYYNSPVLFPRFKVETLGHCLFILAVLVAPFIFALSVSCLSLLVLALNQYVAICSPLLSTTSITKSRACLAIALVWILAALAASLPALFLLIKSSMGDLCAPFASQVGVTSMEGCCYGIAALILVNVTLYALIYREIVQYRRRTPQLARRSRNGDEAEHNYKAFVTTLLLTSTLVFFWLPYTIFNFLSAHTDIDRIPLSVLYLKFYVVDFMPLVNYLADPIIYGIRMREIRDGYRRLFARLLPCCVKEPVRVITRSSVRFTSLPDNSTTV